ncbi:MAG TPA: hypothetical protein ENH91_01330 [Leeuwenhoekiella sp.]|nr:hypothetical protein [Leeuwenhoekiella sp.]
MEIISFLIVVGLLLSSCSTDDSDERVAFNNTDPDNWHTRQHMWRMRTEHHEKLSLQHTEAINNEHLFSNPEPLDVEKELVSEYENY